MPLMMVVKTEAYRWLRTLGLCQEREREGGGGEDDESGGERENESELVL